jgi:hypothetical protein
VARVFGMLAGMGGALHGVGEVLQGNVATDGVVVNSWAEGPIALYMGGEPALTLIPNFLISGMLTLLVSSALVVWAAGFSDRKHSGLVMLLLSALMLLVGGGFAPPVVSLLAGVAGTRVKSPLDWWNRHLGGARGLLADMWKPVWLLCLANGLFLFIGGSTLPFLGFNNPSLFTNSFLILVPLIPLTTVAGIAYELGRRQI